MINTFMSFPFEWMNGRSANRQSLIGGVDDLALKKLYITLNNIYNSLNLFVNLIIIDFANRKAISGKRLAKRVEAPNPLS